MGEGRLAALPFPRPPGQPRLDASPAPRDDAPTVSSPRPWILAARLRTLPAAAVPVLVGSACAHAEGSFHPARGLAALASALFIQVGTNLANDVYDFEKGADRGTRLGPLRVTQAGLLAPGAVRAGAAASFALAALFGFYLVWNAGWTVLALGLGCVAAGVAYTAGPWPLGYRGLGDAAVFLFFGVAAVCGTCFVHAGRVTPLAAAAAVPVGTLATAILVVNNLRDRAGDERAGKRTIAVRFGARAARNEYRALLAASLPTPLLAVAARWTSPWALLCLASLPLAIPLWREVHEDAPAAALNRALAATARLLLVFGALLAAGIAASRVSG